MVLRAVSTTASAALLRATVESLPPVTTEMVVVFAVVATTFVLFVTERFPADITAILAMVTLVVLGPVTGVSVEEGFSGFANDATLTVLAMLIISNGSNGPAQSNFSARGWRRSPEPTNGDSCSRRSASTRSRSSSR